MPSVALIPPPRTPCKSLVTASKTRMYRECTLCLPGRVSLNTDSWRGAELAGDWWGSIAWQSRSLSCLLGRSGKVGRRDKRLETGQLFEKEIGVWAGAKESSLGVQQPHSWQVTIYPGAEGLAVGQRPAEQTELSRFCIWEQGRLLGRGHPPEGPADGVRAHNKAVRVRSKGTHCTLKPFIFGPNPSV